jgi:hypothetical protein
MGLQRDSFTGAFLLVFVQRNYVAEIEAGSLKELVLWVQDSLFWRPMTTLGVES